ncbi:MAG: DUF1080 domain-containing protein [Deltaproteobacteria bacterium]|jgi:hypothetical protein|nr:DUF1080 domain-containing protein [Deltaproteobacteria bacterium]
MNMNQTLIFFIATAAVNLFTFSASAQEVLFERNALNFVTQTNRCSEVVAQGSQPPRFIVDENGYLTYSGDGDFGLVFIDQQYRNFQLDLEVSVPSGHFEYANSGIFFRSKDPRRLDHPGLPEEIIQLAKNRTPGFVSNWSSYEVQLLAGTNLGGPSANKTNGAFYGVPEGASQGQQTRSEYKFDPGETYQVRLVVIEQDFKVYMKWAKSADFVLVAAMTNSDPTRSFEPGYVGLQSYYSNGGSVRALRFSKVTIHELR